MSDEKETNELAELEQEVQEDAEALGGSKEKQREAKGVDSVTDVVKEKGTMDESKLQAAMGSITTIKEQSLSSTVVLKEEDVKYLVEECEVSKEEAEAMLRRHGGDCKAAVVAFIRGQ